MRAGLNDSGLRAELNLPDATRLGSYGLFTRIHVRLRHSSLDRALAAGADPHASPALGCRAQQLTGKAKRKHLADSVRRLRTDAMSPPSGKWSSAIPINREGLIAADPILNQIEADLREGVVYCQGVVELERLLKDGGSSLYGRQGLSALKTDLANALDALEGRG